MSKLKMLKFEAATLQNNGKSMIEKVQRLGVAQLDKINDSRLFCAETSDSVSTYDKSIDIISGALKVLESKGARIGVGMFSGRKDVEEKLYYSKSSNANNALSDAYEILRLNKLVSDLQAEYVRCRTLYDSLYAWREIDVPLSGVSTQSATVLVGSFPVEYDYSTLQNLFAQSLPGINEYQIKIYYSFPHKVSLILCHHHLILLK